MKKSQAKIGQVLHYFDRLNVAVVKLEKLDLKLGDTIILTDKKGEAYTQSVESMQIEHANIDIAKAGDEFGLKTNRKVKERSYVVKLI